MGKLTSDVARTYELGDTNEYPVLGGAIIFEGGIVGIQENGYARALEAGDKFGGFADTKIDNSQGTDGQKTVRTKAKGTIVFPAPSGVTQANIGDEIFAADDDTLTTTASNTFIGKIIRVSDSEISVDFQAFATPKTLKA